MLNGGFEPKDPAFADKIRDGFDGQAFMHTIGASLSKLAPGAVELTLPYREDLTQQHGFIHGGLVATLADNAAGGAAATLLPDGWSLLTAEFKINLLAPAEGDRLVARAEVVRPGRLSVCRSDVFAVQSDAETLCATALVTLMSSAPRPERSI